MDRKNIVLASSSPRRIAMMKENGFDPMIYPSDVEETLPFPMDMETSVLYLAVKKALDAERRLPAALKENHPVIIAADTVVFTDRIIGKPKSEEEAFRVLSSLRGKSHFVATGIAMLQADSPVRRAFCEVTEVFFGDYSDRELRDYVKTSEPYDKAGGYAIQGTFGKYVERIEGDLDNVIGFPWRRIEKELKSFG